MLKLKRNYIKADRLKATNVQEEKHCDKKSYWKVEASKIASTIKNDFTTICIAKEYCPSCRYVLLAAIYVCVFQQCM